MTMKPNEIFGSAPAEQTGFVSFDEIENAFRTPTQRQADYEPKPDPAPGADDLGHLANPDGMAYVDPEPIPMEAEPVVDHTHAMRTGERIARLIDNGIDFALSNFVARNGDSYRADERDLQDIAEAWGEVSEEHQWNIGPEWTLAILYIMVYGPLVKQAFTDRRMAMIEERQAAMEEQLKTIQMNQAAAQAQAAQQPQPQPAATNGKPATDPTAEPKQNPFTYKPA